MWGRLVQSTRGFQGDAEGKKILWRHDPQRPREGLILVYDVEPVPEQISQKLHKEFPAFDIYFWPFIGKQMGFECGYNSVKKVYEIAHYSSYAPGNICDIEIISRCNKIIDIEGIDSFKSIQLYQEHIKTLIRYSFLLARTCNFDFLQSASVSDTLIACWKQLINYDLDSVRARIEANENTWVEQMKLFTSTIFATYFREKFTNIIQLVNDGNIDASMEKYEETMLEVKESLEEFIGKHYRGEFTITNFMQRLKEYMKSEKIEESWTAIIHNENNHWFPVLCCLEKIAGNPKAF